MPRPCSCALIGDIELHQFMVAVRIDTPEKALKAAAACIDGGFRFVEITFTVPGVEEVIKELIRRKDAVIGAGTVLSIGDAKRALKAGAAYVVSPNVDERVIKFVKKEGVVSIPGAFTPTEIYRAHKAGCDIIKLFPFVEMGGLDFLKAVRGPYPDIKYMLCGGVNFGNVEKYLDAKAAGILIGRSVLPRELVEKEDWASIAALARRFVMKRDRWRGIQVKVKKRIRS